MGEGEIFVEHLNNKRAGEMGKAEWNFISACVPIVILINHVPPLNFRKKERKQYGWKVGAPTDLPVKMRLFYDAINNRNRKGAREKESIF